VSDTGRARRPQGARDPSSLDALRDLPLRWALAACLVAYVPCAFLGYGTDIDVANVLRAGRSWLDDGHYRLSRGPGAAIQELATAGLDRLGGSVAVNLAGIAFALLALWSVRRLLRADRSRWPTLATLVLAASPWFWLASTSLGDFTWALGLGLAGALAAQRDRRVLAGILFALAIGCRASTLLLVVAWLAAERTGIPSERVPWVATLRTAAVTAVLGAACFIPSWLDAGHSFAFLHNQLVFAGWGVQLGRWAVKNTAAATVPAGIVLVVGARHLRDALRRWRLSVVVRFAALLLVAEEVLFFRLPFKPVHLLPVVAAVALLAGAAPLANRRWLVALVAAQLLAAAVGTTLAAPDHPDGAESGRIELHLTRGVMLNDVHCRIEDRRLGPWPDGPDALSQAEAMQRAARSFSCQRDSWRAK
jgi:hypothetical protein